MVHTRFFGTESAAQIEFESMKKELARILGSMPLETDPEFDTKLNGIFQTISDFVERFR